MALRKGHGRGAGQPRVEVMAASALPAPVAAPAAVDAGPVARRQDGKLADSEAGRALGRLGGLAKARRVRLIDSLGLAAIAEDSAFGPYRTSAEAFVAHHLADLAAQAGGIVGAAPSTMVASAALQLAASRFAFDEFAKTPLPEWAKLGSSLADASRQNLLAAYELAIREAQARREQRPAGGGAEEFMRPKDKA